MRKLFKEDKVFRRRTLICAGIVACVIVRVGIGIADSEANKIKGMGSEGCVQVATFLDSTDTDSSTENVVVEVVDENGTTTQVVVNTTEGTKPDSSTETAEGSGSATSGEKPDSTNEEGNSSEGGNSGSATTEAPSTQPSGGNGGEKPQTTEKPNNEDTKPESPTTTEQPTTEATTTESTTTEEHSECNHSHRTDVTETIEHPAVYETKTVCVQEAYDEPIKEVHSFCNGCGMDLTANFPNKDYNTHTYFCQGGSSYHADEIIVDYIHHDAVYETKEVCVQEAWTEYINKIVCSDCGAVLYSSN